ncbi:hypothetical protein OEZ86_005440 [Tetradesmus obliquus]|nr:hypothetical protein OEZ86_005440 [Tetradesmus obliquus]
MAEDLTQQQQQEQQQESTGSTPETGSSSSISLASIVTQLASSCAVVNHFDKGFFQALASWLGQLQMQQLSHQQLLAWFQVQFCLTDAEVQFCLTDAAVQLPELRSIGLPNQLLLAAHEAWSKDVSGQRLTAFHKEVHDALQQAGKRCRLNVALDGPLVVDVAFMRIPQYGRKERVAIQLETPDMFAANAPHAALGPTAARWRALQSRGWQVLSLRYSDWCRLKTPEDRARYMWHMREASAVRAPLAPDVVRVGAQQQDSSSKAPKSLSQQLWRLLVD